ncbi:FAD-dependent thymidylate synthase [Herbaspirillum huttiense]|uniref:FAD-dependent thymidylate synthase n=1 Tax=Herbaspirillum huttiense subsp. lycopersici TaxID=3074428 RepID=A0ABU2EH43_9BURK|nr:FAD-dependent thymidylate synthase [Herbaspirillum huttiense]MDR9847102.1 FAD-dependent thymidylate synthase [Herbaspirillum huttiense SE1]
MTISAKVIEHSVSEAGKELVTMELKYPRFIHAEFMTHRVFSRNASSSRAIPVAKMIEQVRTAPAMPIHWGKNQPGMQAFEETLDARVFLDLPMEHDNPSDVPLFTFERTELTGSEAWCHAANSAADIAAAMAAAGYHKQVVNRILEPFLHISVIVTATEWDNFYELRDHPDAQPEIRELARQMKEAMHVSPRVLRPRDRQLTAAWHLPYVTPEERDLYPEGPKFLAKLSAARCARVSYLTHDGREPSRAEDMALYERLVGSRPLHASPIEHQAYPLPRADQRSRNFLGWRQHREIVETTFTTKEQA